MTTTCPNCGTGSPETADACLSCGRGLYRLKDPVKKASSRFGLRAGWTLVTLSVVVLLLGGGFSTVFLLQGGSGNSEGGRASQNGPSGPAVTPDPSPTATRSSLEPARTEPRKAAPSPSREQPQPGKPTTAGPSRGEDGISPIIRRRLQEHGITVAPDADPADARNWHVGRHGNVSTSPDDHWDTWDTWDTWDRRR